MLDRLAVQGSRPETAGAPGGRRWPLFFVGCAGLLGAAGVGTAAAAAHLQGSDLARIAAEFFLVHAAAIVGVSAAALAMPRQARCLGPALVLLVVGSVLFGGELASAGLLTIRPAPWAAPIGGVLLISGWLLLPVGSVCAAVLSKRG